MAPGSPQLQSVAEHGQAGAIGLANSVGLQIFGSAIADLFLLTAGLTAVGMLLALFLPMRRRAAAPATAPPAAHAEV